MTERHRVENLRRLGVLDVPVLHDLDVIAPGIEEVEAAARQDLRTGLLTRTVRWRSPSGLAATLTFERFASLADEHLLYLRCRVTPEFSGTVEFRLGLHGNMYNDDLIHLEWAAQGAQDDVIYLHNRTRLSRIDIVTAMQVRNVIGNELLRQEWDVQNAPTLMIRMEAVPGQPLGLRSRGELVAGFLRGDCSPQDYLAEVARRTGEYSGFNLLVGDTERLCYLHAREAQPRELGAGVYGLCNAALDTPWPKLVRARQALAQRLDTPHPGHLMDLLADPTPADDAHLPNTGVGLDTERLLSSVFIASAHYGTRASSVLIVQANGRREFHERRFGPNGARLGEVSLTL